MRIYLIVVFLLISWLTSVKANASVHDDMKISSILEAALNRSPEFKVKWHEYLASQHDISSARSEYFPKVDLNAEAGYETQTVSNPNGDTNSQVSVSLTQVLFNGFSTEHELSHFSSLRAKAYYALLNTIEDIALETFVAVEDILRYRSLLLVSQQNVGELTLLYKKMKYKVNASIGRVSDLEQIRSKLFLAESNVLTAQSNLHDVKARFYRLTGLMPPEHLENPLLEIDLTLDEALKIAYRINPLINASYRDVESSQSLIKKERSSFYPKISVVGSYGTPEYSYYNNDTNDLYGRISLRMSFNLFDGGRSSASINRAVERKASAQNILKKNCGDVRQTILIAMNDLENLQAQLVVARKHKISSRNVQKVFLDQFKIGQHSLLDLLISENDMFDANRAYIEILHNLAIAKARALAAMGRLGSELNGQAVQDTKERLNVDSAKESDVQVSSLCKMVEEEDVHAGLQKLKQPYKKVE